MQIHEKLSLYLAQKGLSKREFAKMLAERELRSKRTGEIVSEKNVYGYLSGSVSIPIEAITPMCGALDITEQELFDDSTAKRHKEITRLLESLSDSEVKLVFALMERYKEKTDQWTNIDNAQLKELAELLPYCPPMATDRVISIFKRYKQMFTELQKEG